MICVVHSSPSQHSPFSFRQPLSLSPPNALAGPLRGPADRRSIHSRPAARWTAPLPAAALRTSLSSLAEAEEHQATPAITTAVEEEEPAAIKPILRSPFQPAPTRSRSEAEEAKAPQADAGPTALIARSTSSSAPPEAVKAAARAPMEEMEAAEVAVPVQAAHAVQEQEDKETMAVQARPTVAVLVAAPALPEATAQVRTAASVEAELLTQSRPRLSPIHAVAVAGQAAQALPEALPDVRTQARAAIAALLGATGLRTPEEAEAEAVARAIRPAAMEEAELSSSPMERPSPTTTRDCGSACFSCFRLRSSLDVALRPRSQAQPLPSL